MAFSTRAFVHPEDEAAMQQLRAVPLFSELLQAFLKIGPERLLHGVNMAQKVRLGPDQLPELYAHLPPACEALGVAVPEFYLEMNPRANAYTYGDQHPAVTVTSGLVEGLTQREVQAVVAHECGHIALQHTLYHTMAAFLVTAGAMAFGPLAAFAGPVRLALLYWMRRSELSADRAAAAVMGGPRPVVDSFLRLAGGPKSITGAIDVERYAKQAEEYDKLMESQWNQLLQGLAAMSATHPFLAVRTREILNWGRSDQFRRVVAAGAAETAWGGRRCPSCRAPVEESWRFCRLCGTALAGNGAATGAATGSAGGPDGGRTL
jgi:Zn-dependent protease with chaperone function